MILNCKCKIDNKRFSLKSPVVPRGSFIEYKDITYSIRSIDKYIFDSDGNLEVVEITLLKNK